MSSLYKINIGLFLLVYTGLIFDWFGLVAFISDNNWPETATQMFFVVLHLVTIVVSLISSIVIIKTIFTKQALSHEAKIVGFLIAVTLLIGELMK